MQRVVSRCGLEDHIPEPVPKPASPEGEWDEACKFEAQVLRLLHDQVCKQLHSILAPLELDATITDGFLQVASGLQTEGLEGMQADVGDLHTRLSESCKRCETKIQTARTQLRAAVKRLEKDPARTERMIPKETDHGSLLPLKRVQTLCDGLRNDPARPERAGLLDLERALMQLESISFSKSLHEHYAAELHELEAATLTIGSEISRRERIVEIYVEAICEAWGKDRSLWPSAAAPSHSSFFEACQEAPIFEEPRSSSTRCTHGLKHGEVVKADDSVPAVAGWLKHGRGWTETSNLEPLLALTEGGSGWLPSGASVTSTKSQAEVDWHGWPNKRLAFSRGATWTVDRIVSHNGALFFAPTQYQTLFAPMESVMSTQATTALQRTVPVLSSAIDHLAAAPLGSEVREALLKSISLQDVMAQASERVLYWQANWKDARKCTVCFDPAPSCCLGGGAAVQNSGLSACSHAQTACTSCLRLYALNAINEGGISDNGILCFHPKCDAPMPESVLSSVLTPTELEKYTRFVRMCIISKDPNRRWCPQRGCEGIISLDVSTSCPTCQHAICADCSTPTHPGKTCSEAADQGLAEVARQSGWKGCPYCGKLVEKTEGCNQMTCKYLGCSRVFCYACAKAECICSR